MKSKDGPFTYVSDEVAKFIVSEMKKPNGANYFEISRSPNEITASEIVVATKKPSGKPTIKNGFIYILQRFGPGECGIAVFEVSSKEQ